jgi:hypothetical protein
MTDKTDAKLEAEDNANIEAGQRLAAEILPLVKPKFDRQKPMAQTSALFSLAIELLDKDEVDTLGDMLSGYWEP